MTLRNKDGSLYKLQGPNPLVKSQEIWNTSELEFHNLSWEKEIQKSEVPAVPVIPPPADFLTELKETKKIEELPKPKVELPKIKNSILIWCLPVYIETVEDSLYGQGYQKTTYGEKFTFEGVMVERGDLISYFWTAHDISENFIIYPSKYTATGLKVSDFRWWRVVGKKPAKGGFLLDAVPSTFQPDFSD